MMATRARHKLGDLSRDAAALAIIYDEQGDVYVGEWASGLGYINVEFPKATTRPLTRQEHERYNGVGIQTGSMLRVVELGPWPEEDEELVCACAGTETSMSNCDVHGADSTAERLARWEARHG
jgi:hypothetical protein